MGSLELQSRTLCFCPSWDAGLHLGVPAWCWWQLWHPQLFGSGSNSDPAVSAAVLAGFAGFGASVMARDCLGRKLGSWLAVPLSIPASLDRSYQGGCMLGFTQDSSTASVSHLPGAGCPVLGRH